MGLGGSRAAPLAAALLYLVFGVLYLEAVPPWEAPDEPWHMAYAEAVASGRLPSPRDTYESHQPPLYYVWPAIALHVSGREAVPRSAANPLYPFAAAAYLHPPEEDAAAALSLIRAFSGLLGAITVVLTWATIRAGAADDARRAAVGALMVALLPQFIFVGHAVSNDVLASIVGSIVLYGLVCCVVDRPSQHRGVMAVAIGLSLAVFSKLNVFALVPGVLAAALLAPSRAERSRISVPRAAGELAGRGPEEAQSATGAARPAAPAASLVPRLGRSELWWRAIFLTAAAGLAVGSAAILRVIAPGTADALAAEAVLRFSEVDPALTRPIELGRQILRLVVSTWARFGWLNVDLPLPLTVVAIGAAGLGFAGLLPAWAKADRKERRVLVVMAVVVASSMFAAIRNLLIDPQPQGRFLFPAIGALAFLVAGGLTALVSRRWRGLLALVVAATLGGANLLATVHVLPQAYAPSRQPAPEVYLRLVKEPRQVVARLEDGGPEVRQTFELGGEGACTIAVAPAAVAGAGELALHIRDSGGALLVSRRFDIGSAVSSQWWMLELGTALEGGGRRYDLELSLDGEGAVALWGADVDVYSGGTLTLGGRPSTDLHLLAIGCE